MMKVDLPIEPELVRRYEQMTPVGRMGHPKDIANTVAFLAGEDADFINRSRPGRRRRLVDLVSVAPRILPTKEIADT